MSEGATPRVSVVVIFLDAERFLAEALDSVLAQTYDDWELLLVDDGSTDRSTELALEYARRDPARIRYLEHPDHANRGMSASRNRGIEAAGGEYVAFLDADDVWLPRKLERQVPLLDSHPRAGMLYGVTERWASWTGKAEDAGGDFVRPLPFEADRLFEPPVLLRHFLRNRGLPCIGSVLALREALDAIGGFNAEFPIEFQVYEDQVFHAKMTLNYPVYASTACWDRYRKHPDQSCAVASEAGLFEIARQHFLAFLQGYLVEHRVDDPEIWDVVQRELKQPRQAAPRTALGSLARSASNAAATPAGLYRGVRAKLATDPTPRVIRRLRRARSETLVRLPTRLIVDDYGFSLAPEGWHYFRSLVAEHERDPRISLEETTFFGFFQHDELRSVRYLDDVLFLHVPQERARNGFKFYFGTYPWGDWTLKHALVGGNPFGHYFDLVEGRETRDIYGYKANAWYRPADDHPLRGEWVHTIRLYEALKKGYRPARHDSFPSVVLLVRSDGEIRAVRYEGHHRLCLLAHLGHEELIVAVRPESVRVVDERELEDWYYVRRGLCPPERALEIFNAFFELDGSERLSHLGLPRAY